MREQFSEWWRELETFDRLGAGLVGWEFFSLGVGVVVLPLAESGLVAGPLLVLLAANAVAMGTAVMAWVLTHLLVTRRSGHGRRQTVQEWLAERLRACRVRRSETP